MAAHNKTDQPLAVLDISIGLMQAGDDRDILSRMTAIYLEEIPERMETLNTALSAGDFRSLKSAAHSLKSVSAVIGALKASDAAVRLEKNAAAEDPEACRAGVVEMIKALMEVEARLHDLPDLF